MPDGSKPSQFTADAVMKTETKAIHAVAAEPLETQPADIAEPSRKGFSLSRLFRGKPQADASIPVPNGNEGERALTPSEKAMIERVVALDNVRVGDVAIPRADITSVEVETTLAGLLKCFAEAGHSRLPVFRGDLDDPLGFVHIKDVVDILSKDQHTDEDQPLGGIVRKLLYAPPSMPASELLLRMQAQRIHMALVIDEFGGTDGLVTIEDLIEEIVGDIRDEHDDTDDVQIKETPGGQWACDARVELEYLANKLGRDLRLEDEEADTLGGLVFSLAGRVPVRGEVIKHPDNHEFEILEADPRLVRRVLIKLADATEPTEGDGGS